MLLSSRDKVGQVAGGEGGVAEPRLLDPRGGEAGRGRGPLAGVHHQQPADEVFGRVTWAQRRRGVFTHGHQHTHYTLQNALKIETSQTVRVITVVFSFHLDWIRGGWFA